MAWTSSSADERHHELDAPATRRAAPHLALETASASAGKAAGAAEHGVGPLGAARATGPDPEQRVVSDAERLHLEARHAGALRAEGCLRAERGSHELAYARPLGRVVEIEAPHDSGARCLPAGDRGGAAAVEPEDVAAVRGGRGLIPRRDLPSGCDPQQPSRRPQPAAQQRPPGTRTR